MKKNVFRFFLITFCLVVTFSSGYILASKSSPKQTLPKVTIGREVPAAQDIDFALFWQVWDLLEQNYYDKSKIIASNMVYGAIKGMVEALADPYTAFLTQEETRISGDDLDGNFEGVGIQIGFKGKQLVVISPLKSSPAEKAGILAGDFIIGIKDEVKNIDIGTVGISLPEAVAIIRGAAGTKVTLALLRDNVDKPIITEVVRESISVPSVSLEFVGEDKSIAHIKVLKFGGETKTEWDRAVAEILKLKNFKGVVLDVRNDPGGYLQGAVDIASEFLEKGKAVVVEERSGGQQSELVVMRAGYLTKAKLVVLINEGSASASEIVAGALRDQKSIKLVGETTFGKGTVQERQELGEGVALHMTAARWLTPKRTWINDTGIEPDVKIEDNPDTPEDEQLEKALELFKN